MSQYSEPEAPETTRIAPPFATDVKEIFTPIGKRINLGDGVFRLMGAVIKGTQDDHFTESQI